MRVAYLSNRFPGQVESYVWEEAVELRKRGCEVLLFSFRKPTQVSPELAHMTDETQYLLPIRFLPALIATCLLIFKFPRIADFG